MTKAGILALPSQVSTFFRRQVPAAENGREGWAQVRAVLRKRVKKKLLNATSPRPKRRVLRVDPVTDLLGQLSYCIKFVTYDRLPKAAGGGLGKPVPLKGAPLAELAVWRAQYSPDDSLFLYGAKRLNGRFTRLARAV